ncbi:MAG: hypothetical protein MN733_41880, partial [Nitrososphaera sp.]|nr:hypothetical protein [Nitrososphaera sp.]
MLKLSVNNSKKVTNESIRSRFIDQGSVHALFSNADFVCFRRPGAGVSVEALSQSFASGLGPIEDDP